MKKVMKGLIIAVAIILIAVAFITCDTGGGGGGGGNQTPIASDFNISNLTQTVGSVTPVTITPKPGKSTGTITIYYDGSTTLPTTVGTYSVTFDIAAATGWNAVTGLSAGTLTINAIVTPVAADFNIGNLTQTAGSVTAVTITPKTGKSTGTITIYYDGSTTLPTAVGTYSVTFDVAAATGYNAATGLSAGTLTIKSLIDMVWVPGGSFTMGQNGDGTSDNVTPTSTVTLTGFYMGKYEVTQEQYQAVTGTNPSIYNSNPAAGEVQGKRPVEGVTWYDAILFCNRLSLLEGLTPAYQVTGVTNWNTATAPTSDNTDWNNATILVGSDGYRLPTKAQWEYAAKGGNGSPSNYIYAGSNIVDDVAWDYNNSNSRTHEVGLKTPNELGLYDMSGNVSEWCWDWYESYTSTAKTDPTGAASGIFRMMRGGNWSDTATRSVYRFYILPHGSGSGSGFRLVRP